MEERDGERRCSKPLSPFFPLPALRGEGIGDRRRSDVGKPIEERKITGIMPLLSLRLRTPDVVPYNSQRVRGWEDSMPPLRKKFSAF
jgi:hypothetical protein